MAILGSPSLIVLMVYGRKATFNLNYKTVRTQDIVMCVWVVGVGWGWGRMVGGWGGGVLASVSSPHFLYEREVLRRRL